MNYTIALINNRPRCMVRTLDNRIIELEENEIFELIKNIEEDNRFREHNNNTNNLFLKHSKYNISVLFKDYEELYTPLCRLYNKYAKKEIRDQKIKSIKTKAAIGVLTSGIITATLANQFGAEVKRVMENTKYEPKVESIFTPIEEEGLKVSTVEATPTIASNEGLFISDETKEKTNVAEEVKLTEPTDVANTNVVQLSDAITIEPNEAHTPTPLEPIQLEVDANYSEGINDRTDPYKEEIEKYGKKRGISPELLYDIVSQEYGGEGSNLMHVVFDSWKNQTITTFNFETNRLESMILTDTPEKYAGKVDIIITRNDLKNYKTNLAVGTIILQYSLAQFDYNIPLGIQAYNNGVGAVNQIVAEASRKTGMSVDAIIKNNDPIWLKYTNIIEQGDEKYFKNVVKHIDEDQVDSKTNDVYSVQYMDNGELQTNEVQFKLR